MVPPYRPPPRRFLRAPLSIPILRGRSLTVAGLQVKPAPGLPEAASTIPGKSGMMSMAMRGRKRLLMDFLYNPEAPACRRGTKNAIARLARSDTEQR
jgi:hypothetical protein